MKAGLLIVVTLLIGAVLAHFLLENNGYVLISFRGYTVEMSVPVLLFVLLAAVVHGDSHSRAYLARTAAARRTGRARPGRARRQADHAGVRRAVGGQADARRAPDHEGCRQ